MDASGKNEDDFFSFSSSLQQPITASYSTKLSQNCVFEQVLVESWAPVKKSSDGYDAAHMGLCLASASTAPEVIRIGKENVLYGDEKAVWRQHVIEARKIAFATDYLKDMLLLTLKGGKAIPIQEITLDFTRNFSRLYLYEYVMVADPESDPKKDHSFFNILTPLFQTVATRLIAQTTHKANTTYEYTFSREAIMAIIREEAQKANVGPEIIETYLGNLQDTHFTLECSVNENKIHGIDYMTHNPKTFVRTYKSQDKPVSESIDSASDSSMMNGDWLQPADLEEIVQFEKHHSSSFFGNTALVRTRVRTIICFPKADSFLQDLHFQFESQSLITDMLKNPHQTQLVFIQSDDHWIPCILRKDHNMLRISVADSQNLDRQNEPIIQKIVTTYEDTFKQPAKDKKPKLDDLFNQPAPVTPALAVPDEKDKTDKINYDAPLAQFSLEDLPTLEQLFGGTVPNDIKVRVAQLKNGSSKVKAAGTKIKNCLILYGPPGTGKSTIAQVMARIAGWDMLFMSGGAFRNAYQGSSKAILDGLFAEAKRRNRPTVVIIDEIDGTSSKLEANSYTQEDNRAVKVLITTLDQYRHDPNLFVICTTNNPEKIDPAILRRFTCIEVPLPDFNARKQILEHYLEKNLVKIDGTEFGSASSDFVDALASATDGFSGDALEDMVSNAALYAEQKLHPEKKVGMTFWFRGIDTQKSFWQNMQGLLNNPYVPLLHYAGGYKPTEFDRHLYSQFKRHQKVRHDVEKRENAEDPVNKLMKKPFREKLKTFAWNTASTVHYGICTSIGHDVYAYFLRNPALMTYLKARRGLNGLRGINAF